MTNHEYWTLRVDLYVAKCNIIVTVTLSSVNYVRIWNSPVFERGGEANVLLVYNIPCHEIV
jgi:hypothetical protein